MRFILKLLISLILIVVIIVGAAGAFLYLAFFNPQPADYAYMQSTNQITSIEIAEVGFTGTEITSTGIGLILDKDAFVKDLNELQCCKGIDLSSLSYLAENQNIEGIIIHYTDGSSEVITPYLSVGVTADGADFSRGIYSFDVNEFGGMLDEYKDLYINPDVLDQIPDLE